MSKEHLEFVSIQEHPDLVSESVYQAVGNSQGVLVGKIDPEYMNGTALSEQYDVNLEDGANCLVVGGKREGVRMKAAIVVPVGYRADLNRVVCEVLGVRKVSMAPLDEVIAESGMEYGSITPVGLPESWKVLIDSRLMEKESIVVGGGKQISKLRVTTAFLKQLPNVEVVEYLAHNVTDV